MKNTFFRALFFLAVCLVVSNASAQSGRRTKPAPAPTAPVASNDEVEFSESKPSSGPVYSKKAREQAAQRDKPVPKPDDTASVSEDDEVIRVGTELVTVPVSVYERSGVYVSGLRRSDFRIYENGSEQEIAYFGTTEVPFTVVLLVDVSGSTDQKIKQIQSAALSFIQNLKPTDRVSIVEFASGIDTLCDFTTDRAVLEKAISKLNSGGGTALYSAVEDVLKKKFRDVQSRKAVVLFTDGVDTSGRDSGYEKSLALAEESDAAVYSVYYNTYLEMRGINTGQGPMSGIPNISRAPNVPGMRPEDYARGRAYLEELARITGAKMFRSDSTNGGLNAAFAGIADELGNQYSIGYYPKNSGGTGERKQIKVRVARPNVGVRARDSYIVGQVEKKAGN
jgi:Ca-activated chloride channel family protein